MSFLNEINSEHLAARITNKGRKKIAQGDFNIHYFQLGDSEFDYSFSEFDGTSTRPAQKVFTPLDRAFEGFFISSVIFFEIAFLDLPLLRGISYVSVRRRHHIII